MKTQKLIIVCNRPKGYSEYPCDNKYSLTAMAFSFQYTIDPKVCKTEEDPQEQLHFKVPSGQSGVRMYRLQKSIIYKFVDRHKVRIVLIVEFPNFLYVESYYIYFPKNYHVVYKFQILCQMSLASNLICFDYYHLLSSSSILPRVRRI